MTVNLQGYRAEGVERGYPQGKEKKRKKLAADQERALRQAWEHVLCPHRHQFTVYE